jgi:hypothetical protein
MLTLLPSPPSDAPCDPSLALESCPTVELEARRTVGLGELQAACVLVIARGFVLLTARRAGRRRPVVLSLAGPGAVLPPLAPGEELAGLTDASVIVVPAALHELLVSLPGISAMLMDGLIDSLAERQESLANAIGGNHAERLRRKLFQLARLYGRVCRDGIAIDLPLTHELLAQMIGSARETVTCILADFQREGLLVRNGRAYRLTVSPDALERA